MVPGSQMKEVFWPQSLRHHLLDRPPVTSSQGSPQKSKFEMAAPWSTVTGARGCWGFPHNSTPTAPAPVLLEQQTIVRLEDCISSPAKYRIFINQSRAHYDKAAAYMRKTGITTMRVDADGWWTPIRRPLLTVADLKPEVPMHIVE
ncbi:hypothetical protein HDV57DRAFT_491070 [Trichoderma longibrachiatum]